MLPMRSMEGDNNQDKDLWQWVLVGQTLRFETRTIWAQEECSIQLWVVL
jgi:hypothetical protein